MCTAVHALFVQCSAHVLHVLHALHSGMLVVTNDSATEFPAAGSTLKTAQLLIFSQNHLDEAIVWLKTKTAHASSTVRSFENNQEVRPNKMTKEQQRQDRCVPSGSGWRKHSGRTIRQALPVKSFITPQFFHLFS